MEKIDRLIKSRYGFNTVALHHIHTKQHVSVYKVIADTNLFILRIFSETVSRKETERNIEILQYLERRNYPAPRVIRTLQGDSIINFDKSYGTLISFIQGIHPDMSDTVMEKMGELTGKLHTLPLDPNDRPPEATWGVVQEQEKIAAFLKRINLDEMENNEIIPEWREAFTSLPSLNNLPKSIIHTDIHKDNIIETPENEMVLIDWDDAGLGISILDLGLVLSLVCIQIDEASQLPVWKENMAKAFMRGYTKFRKLSEVETENLIDAMNFCALVYTVQWWDNRISMNSWLRYQLQKKEGFNLLKNIQYES